ncbi:hypothetical protein EBU95_01520 [bacterium]|nr:hypothetical protein [bacterium]
MAFETDLGYLRTLATDGVNPVDSAKDAVEKIRVSNPQSLIDTDFEYSLQSSKWEFLTTSNNYPGVYARANEPAFTAEQITSIIPTGPGNRDVLVTVNITPRIPFKTGDSIVIKDSLNTTYVDGAYVITQVPSQFSFIITTKSPTSLVGDQKTPYTAMFTGGLYSNVSIPINKITSIAGTSAAIIDFRYPHGLFKNSPIIIIDSNQPTARYCGTFNINTILSDTSASYVSNVTSPFATSTRIVPSSGLVYARTEGVAIHRYFDGGVQINPGTSAPNAQIIRQTRKYFKYQSGKSVQFSTGILFLPVYEVSRVSVDTSKFENSNYVSKIIIDGVNSSSNGTYTREYDINGFNQSTSFYGPSGNEIYLNTSNSRWTIWDGVLSARTFENTSTPISAIDIGSWVALPAGTGTMNATNTISRGYNFYDFVIDTVQYHGFSPVDEYRESAYVETVGFELSAQASRNPYNGYFAISEVVNSKQFRVRMPVSDYEPFPTTDLKPGGIGKVRVKNFNDATVRSGMFDEQNGLFFEYDGKNLYCVKRQSTTPIAGTCTATLGNPLLSSYDGNCRFKTQLNEGDFIVIRGQSYLILKIIDDNNLRIAPYYRGPTIENIIVNKTEEIRTRQDDFNIDKLDGTGPSGYTVDLNKMQMIFIDYSWYGAGKVRYGIRSNKGKIIYFHELYNNNVNDKAYMRSGNLPGRFEITSRSKKGKIVNAIPAQNTSLPVISTTAKGLSGTKTVQFAVTGDYSSLLTQGTQITVTDCIGIGSASQKSGILGTFNLSTNSIYNGASNRTTVEYTSKISSVFGNIRPAVASNIVVYTGGSQNILKVSEEDAYYLPSKGRLIVNNEYIEYQKSGKTGGNVNLVMQNRNTAGLLDVPAIEAGDSYLSYNQNCSPALSHWGVAALIDGGFTEDKSYLFTGSTDSYLTVASDELALLSIRLAPSVDYGITAPFGVRNLINHSSMRLKNLGIVTTNPIQVFIRLNCDSTLFRTSSGWLPGGNGSIAQYWDHSKNGSFLIQGTGGDLIGSFFLAPNTPATTTYRNPTYVSQDFDIEVVRDLGNSIIGGNLVYPDGPDILTLSVKTFDSYKALTRARVSWTEDQG